MHRSNCRPQEFPLAATSWYPLRSPWPAANIPFLATRFNEGSSAMHRPRMLPLPVATLLFLSGLAIPTALFAQTTADIVGRVSDASGGVLPGATVTIENVGTGNLQTTITSDTGDYVFTLLPIGTYTVKIEMQGFQADRKSTRLNSS